MSRMTQFVQKFVPKCVARSINPCQVRHFTSKFESKESLVMPNPQEHTVQVYVSSDAYDAKIYTNCDKNTQISVFHATQVTEFDVK